MTVQLMYNTMKYNTILAILYVCVVRVALYLSWGSYHSEANSD